ncbi:MAG: putative dehydrogenase [Arenicella sp.]|jgi:predicted dehydrogenase
MFNWAVIGTGGIADRFTSVLTSSRVSGCEAYGQLRGVLATSESKARDFIVKHQGAACAGAISYDDISALIADAEIDAVYIATPHTSHYDFTRQLLMAQKPVLCEKPLTVTAAETQHLIELARHNKVFLMEALWTKTLPVWHRVKQLLKQGEIGEVDHFSADMGFYFPYDSTHRLFNRELAGGILLDMGVYPISLANWLAGVPIDITASSVFSDQGVDLKTMVNMRFDKQLTASFTLSTKSTTENAFWIYGEDGWIRVDDLFSESQGLTYQIAGQTTKESYPFEINGFEYQIAEVVKCVSEGIIEHENVTHQNTLEVMTIVDRIREQIGLQY